MLTKRSPARRQNKVKKADAKNGNAAGPRPGGGWISYADAPSWLAHNPFLTDGFRPQYNSITRCLLSAFAWHNETLNFWTAFAGFAMFLYLAIDTHLHLPSDLFWARVCFGIFFVTGLNAFCGSMAMHLLGTNNRRTCVLTSTWDYSAIAGLIAGSYFPPAYFLLHCRPGYAAFYLSVEGLLGLSATVLPFFRWFHAPRLQPVRIGLFMLCGGFGVVPLTHLVFWAPLPPGFSLVEPVLRMYALFGTGILFFVRRWPERWAPGRFNIVGASHQIWHCFVLAGTYAQYRFCWSCFLFWQEAIVDRW